MSKRDVSPIIAGAAWFSGFARLFLHELERQGWTAEQIISLVRDTGPEWQPIQKIVSSLKYSFPSEIFAHELIPSGCKIVVDVKPAEFQIQGLELVPVLNQELKEPFVSGEVMRERAVVYSANFGLADGKHIRGLSSQIPVEWQKFHIVLSGTLLFDTKGERLKIGVLHCQNGLWLLDFLWLGPGWYNYHRLVRLKSK